MTPPDPDLPLDDAPLDDDALAVQAVVDDEATPEQRRRVARDPELVAEVARVRQAVAAVATPVEPPPADVLAALRARAVAALDEPIEADEPAEADPPAPDVPSHPPVADLGAARARRSRRLPPLPAVAAVVILLVVVGVGLLVAGSGGEDADTGATSSADADGGGDAGGSGEGDVTAGAEEGAGESAADADRPSDALRAELLEGAQARYADDEELAESLREVDLDSLAVAGEGTGGDGLEEQAPSTTTTGPEGASGDDEATTTTAETAFSADARTLARDPLVTRCDDVLRAAEPELGPVTAAVLVEVDGVPVLVLSNPVEVSDQAPSGVRLTALNAVDCSPRTAVLR
jgi:hypothetical protein